MYLCHFEHTGDSLACHQSLADAGGVVGLEPTACLTSPYLGDMDDTLLLLIQYIRKINCEKKCIVFYIYKEIILLIIYKGCKRARACVCVREGWEGVCHG